MKATTSQVIKQQVVYIPVKDLQRAKAFYAAVFEFDIDTFRQTDYSNGEKWVTFPLRKIDKQGDPILTGFSFLGLGYSPHLIPSQQGTLPFLPCDDIEATLESVKKHGGSIIQGKTRDAYTSETKDKNIDLYHAYFIDTEGNKVALTYCRISTMLSIEQKNL